MTSLKNYGTTVEKPGKFTMMKRFAVLSPLIGLCLYAADLSAVTFELYPGSRHKDKVVYCVGKEAEKVRFVLAGKDWGHYKLPDFKEPLKPLYLNVYWPANVELIGHSTGGNLIKPPFTSVEKNGEKFKLLRSDFQEQQFVRIVLKGGNYMEVFIWFKAPEHLNQKFFWELKYGDETLAEETAILRTAGTIKPGVQFSKNFIVLVHHEGIDCGRLEGKDIDDRIDFYKRAGFTHFGMWHRPQPRTPKILSIMDRLRAKGIKIIFDRHQPTNFHDYNQKFVKEQQPGGKGLFAAAEEFRRSINSPMEREYFEKHSAARADGIDFDYETYGPQQIPGWHDTATIKEFAKSIGFEGEMTEALLRSKYHKQYYDYRMKLCTLPILGLREMIDQVKPGLPLFVTHGSGLPIYQLDYKVYDPLVQYHLPMIYTRSGMEFYNRVRDFVKYVDKAKAIPVATAGWFSGPVTKADPEDYTMNVVAAAVCGCAGISQWPTLNQNDAVVSYGLYKGAALAAPFIKFFQHGKESDEVRLEAVPLVKKLIKVGANTIDLSTPQWANSSVLQVRGLDGEYALAMLNYNKQYDLFVKVSATNLRGNYSLLEPYGEACIEVDGKKSLPASALARGVYVKVPKNSAQIWLLTPDVNKAATYAGVDSKVFKGMLDEQIAATKKTPTEESVAIGKTGNITTGYRNFTIGDKSFPAFFVNTPKQELTFLISGGRIIEWKLGGGDNFVRNENFNTDGFGMDMLWVPIKGRWSGDEIAQQNVVKCVNDGKQVELVFEGGMHNSLPGTRLLKTYRLNAEQTDVEVQIKLFNENPAPHSTISYWNHNVLNTPGPKSELITLNDNGEAVTLTDAEASYSNLRKKYRPEEYLQKHVRGQAANVFGVYIPEQRFGVKLTLPETFLVVYRWSDNYRNNPEWMSHPTSVPCGGTLELKFSIQVLDNLSKNDFIKHLTK